MTDTLVRGIAPDPLTTVGPLTFTFDGADKGSSEGVLKPGKVVTYRVSYDIAEADIVSGGLSNIVNVTSAAQGISDSVTHSSDPADVTLSESRELMATLTLAGVTTRDGEPRYRDLYA